MATKRSSSAKENKQPIDPAPDADLDDFVLAKPGPSKKARFAKPLSERQMTDLEKGPVVPNTEKSTAWALRTFNDWRNERNKQSATGDICPLDLLEKPEAEKLNFWLSRFVVEARRKDGEPYPARTLYLLLAGLLRYGRSKSKLCPNFMDKSDCRFSELSGVCESVSRQLRKDGVGASVKHAAIITPEEEDLLLDKGVMGIYAPKPLVRAVFFYVGKAFCLRGGAEQRALKPSQFERGYNPDRYTYTENGSKNHRGGFGSLHDSNKVVTVYSTLVGNSGDPLRDVVYLLDYYFSKFPKPPLSMEFMYLQPKPRVPADPNEPWFHPNPMGKNTLHSLLGTMCVEAGIEEKKSNHSLRATGATAMFAAQVPEKMIKDVTGHKSSKALALYERPTLAQKQALSKVLAGGPGSSSSTSFSEEVDKLRCNQSAVQRSEHHLHAKSAVPPGLFSSLFHGVSHCTINFAPKTINIGVGVGLGGVASTEEMDEFDSIVSDMPLDF